MILKFLGFLAQACWKVVPFAAHKVFVKMPIQLLPKTSLFFFTTGVGLSFSQYPDATSCLRQVLCEECYGFFFL
jgi:hypothetical protein